jgi:hypothetical protein
LEVQGCEDCEVVALEPLDVIRAVPEGDGSESGAFALGGLSSLVGLEEVSRLGAFDEDIADRSCRAVVLEGRIGAQT